MEAHILQENWSEIKNLIKNKWSKLPDQVIEGAKENLDLLGTSVQKYYHSTEENVERELKEFKMSMQDHFRRKARRPAPPLRI